MMIIGYLVWSTIVYFFSLAFIVVVMETFQEREIKGTNDEVWAKRIALCCGVLQFLILIDP